jgi:ATP-binding protein involved in chromosome partitioning
MEVFGSGGGAAVAEAWGRATGTRVPLLGQIPLDPRVREGGDAGAPIVLTARESPAAAALRQVAEALAARQRSLVGRSLGLAPVGQR